MLIHPDKCKLSHDDVADCESYATLAVCLSRGVSYVCCNGLSHVDHHSIQLPKAEVRVCMPIPFCLSL